MTAPSEDEGLNIIRPDKSPPRLLQTAISRHVPEPASEAMRRSGFGPLKFAAIFLLVTVLLGLGVFYVLEREEPRRSPAMVGVSDAETAAPAPAPVATPPPPVPVTADMLRVSSIALGDTPLAMVNGRPVASGDTLVLTTPAGAVTLLVSSIEDGVVRFDHGGQLIEARLPADAAQKKPR